MLTYSKLGINGRLGNQMFQFAALYAAAKRVGVDFFLYERTNPNVSNFETIDAVMQFDLKSAVNCKWIKDSEEYINLYKSSITQRFLEPHFHYAPEIQNLKDNTDLDGYYQSEKYFLDCKSDLCKLFSLANKSEAFEKYQLLIKSTKLISVHIRRSDYTNRTNFHSDLASSYYYYKAITELKMANPDAKFLVFSDDIEFCKEYFAKYFEENPDDFEYVTGTTGPEDILLQSLCFGNIIANSSFSWWGAWLRQTPGPVVAPNAWFGPDGPKDIQDIYASGWTTL